MPRTVRDARLETRTARERLRAQKEPHWKGIVQGLALGYYRGPRGGTWIARYRPEGLDTYKKRRLGLADDVMDADGRIVLTFPQAQEAARAWFAEEARKADGVDEEDPQAGPYTVADAARDYLAWYADHRKALRNTRHVVDAHILPTLGYLPLERLSARRLAEWHKALAAAPARLRSPAVGTRRVREADPNDPETARRRRSTANRCLTVVKAILNRAFHEGRVASDGAWRRVKPFAAADAVRADYLTIEECRRLTNAAAPDLRLLIRGALSTGCRYGELTAVRVEDFNPDSGTVQIRASKSGRARHVALNDEGRALFAGLTVGRPRDALVFPRADGNPWARSHQARPLAAAAEAARIGRPITFHALRHTHASHLAMSGVPMAVVAEQLGHADLRMTSRHYAHLCPDFRVASVRAGLPAFGGGAESKVEPFRTREAG